MQTPDTDRHLKGAMERAWPQLSQLLARLMLVIGLSEDRTPERIPRVLRVHILRLLRPAEALARRLIVLMAREVELTALSPLHGRGEAAIRKQDRITALHGSTLMVSPTNHATMSSTSPHGERSRTTRRLGTTFTFFEPLCTRRYAPAPQRPIGPGPRILSLDAPYPAAPVKQTDHDASAAPLIARLRGLKRVLERPETYAIRHARFLAKRSGPPPLRGGSGWGRLSPIRPGWPPGRRSPHTPPWLADMLAHFTSEIRLGPPRMPHPALPDHTLRPAAPQAGA